MAGSDPQSSSSSSGKEEELSSESSESESEPHNKSSEKTLPPSDELNSHKSEIDKTPKTPQLPEPTTKPVASNPMDDDQSRKPRSKNPTSRYSPPPLKQSTGKRPAVEDEGSDLKRIKKNTVATVATDAENGGEKKLLFQRLWSEENEIELIQGMIDYVKEKGKDPLADINDFHEFVKKSLHVDVNHTQVVNKARRLKKKFKDNAARAAKGKVRSLSNPHEKKMYELSINLWGNSNEVVNYVAKKVKAKVNETPKSNKIRKPAGSGNGNVGIQVTASEVESKVAQPVRSSHLGSMGIPITDGTITDGTIVSKGLEMVSGAKKVEMAERWKKLQIQELEHFLKKVDLLKEQAEVVLNAIANSGAK